MALQREAEFIADIKERIGAAKFLEAVRSWDFCRAKFEVRAKGGYVYHLALRIISFENDEYIGVALDTPRSTDSIRSAHPFFHKLKDRIHALAPSCED